MIHHLQHRRQQTPTRAKWLPVWVALAGWAIGPGDAFVPPPLQRAATSPCSSHPRGRELASQSQSASSSSDADLLQDLPFVPKEVMGKFMAAVGDPLTAASLEQGYQAGVVSQDELREIQTRMPGMMPESNTNNDNKNNNPLQIQSVQTIEAHWRAAMEGQPWHVQSMCKLATSTIVPLVAKLQEKSVRQARAMKWINEEALPLLQRNTTLVGLLLQPDSAFFETSPTTQLAFNNTRAKYEADRGVWSASMDVFVAGGSRSSTSSDTSTSESETPPKTEEDKELSEAGAALQALTEGMDEDEISSFVGSVAVLEKEPTKEPSVTDDDKTVGLVNAYFVPDEEIKILVVEIDGILHNVTWKGLD